MVIKLVVLDADGVLIVPNTAISDALQQKFRLSAQDLAPMWSSYYRQLSRGEITTEDFLDRFSAAYHIDRTLVSVTDFAEPYQLSLAEKPGMHSLVQRLAEQNLTLAVLSDTSPIIHNVRKDWGVFRFFDSQFLSFTSGVMKPDHRAFQAVLAHYQLQPQEIFFVDDNVANVAAAQQLGIQATVFASADDLAKVLRSYNLLSMPSNAADNWADSGIIVS